MKKRIHSKYILACFGLLLSMMINQNASATHLRAGNITVQRVDCSGLTVKITITAYTNAGSIIIFSDHGGGVLDFGDGSPINNPPPDAGIPVPNFPPEFHYEVYTIEHTYAGAGRYVISYFEANRNEGILNIFDSVDTPFYIETAFDIDPLKGCDNSPVLTVPPIDKACSGTTWVHNPGAYDPDPGDSLSYVLVTPKEGREVDVVGYHDPNFKDYYVGLTYPYSNANQARNGPPLFSIDAITGTITWNAPGHQGQYNIAFHVIEWRKVKGVWIQLGYVTRDMQIIVEGCDNHPPALSVPLDTCVVAGTILDKNITATDPDHDPVRIDAFSQIFSINPSPATVKPVPPDYQPSPASVHFQWPTNCLHVKEQPYQVVFKATDKPAANGSTALVDFKTWNITVVGPAPKWTSVQGQAGHKAKLVWEPYECARQDMTMQIWRRVKSNPYDPPACVTGMPPSLGFTLIDVIPIATTQYVDTNGGKGLAAGAQYCYRLVAVFPAATGSLSYVSKEECFTELIDAPVITNVSIDVTNMPIDPAVGEDTIKWLAPLKANVSPTLPPPYSYIVYRSEGTGPFTQITPGHVDTTFFIDSNIDTNEKTYNYQIAAYSSNGLPIDTSAAASTVRLTLRPNVASIDLTWNATVPWSIIIPTSPLHTVYRGPEGSTKLSDLQMLATVDVARQGFHYTDNSDLDKTKIYCYCVQTEGGYGNPLIKEPLTNFSQISCVQPNDSVPPCAVVIHAQGTNCSAMLTAGDCKINNFSNTLTWNRPTTQCAQEVSTYNIYAASQAGGVFSIRATNVADTFFIDNNLASFAQCYKVSAVSRSNIESALSDAFCFDNCPHYELPNVFTPGTDDPCNSKFSAFSDRLVVEEGGSTPLCGTVAPGDIVLHCAKFVNAVNFTVYNRWGKEVYSYQSGGENSIYIDWDGRDDQGKELSAGVYYYLAEVNFNVVNPSQQNKNIKGWVQIVR